VDIFVAQVQIDVHPNPQQVVSYQLETHVMQTQEPGGCAEPQLVLETLPELPKMQDDNRSHLGVPVVWRVVVLTY